MLQFVLKEIKTREENVHSLETATRLPFILHLPLWDQHLSRGEDSLLLLTIKWAWCTRGKEQQLWLLTLSHLGREPGMLGFCWLSPSPLVPESRTPAYRIGSPTHRAGLPSSVKPQRHPQNIPRCLAPRWSLTKCWQWRWTIELSTKAILLYKENQETYKFTEILNSGRSSAHHWHFHTI